MTLLRRHPVLALCFGVALIVTLFFAGRFVTQVVYWSDPARQEQEVEGWMTLRYIARSWNLSPQDLYQAAGLGIPQRGHPMSLEQLAKDRNLPLAQVIAEVQDGINRLIHARDGDRTP